MFGVRVYGYGVIGFMLSRFIACTRRARNYRCRTNVIVVASPFDRWQFVGVLAFRWHVYAMRGVGEQVFDQVTNTAKPMQRKVFR